MPPVWGDGQGRRPVASSKTLPGCRLVVLEEEAPEVLAGAESREDRIENARRAVDDVQRRVEAVRLPPLLGQRRRVLVGNPARFYAVLVHAAAHGVGPLRA